ncbi:MAG: hypothetical protein D6744_00550, partial [Planctomycetota bacterium]
MWLCWWIVRGTSHSTTERNRFGSVPARLRRLDRAGARMYAEAMEAKAHQDKLICGKSIAACILDETAARVARLKSQVGVTPCLATVLV